MSGGRRHYPANDNLSGLCFLKKVGNVRSCRLYYVYFAKEFEAVYFHAGESKYALDVLNSSFIDNVDGITGKGGAFITGTIAAGHRIICIQPEKI